MMKQKRTIEMTSFLLGLLFTFIIAMIGFIIVYFPGLNKIGPLACSIIVAVVYRNVFGYPTKLAKGITFSSTYLLRFAIILFGLKLNIDVIFQDGISLLLKSMFVVIVSILLMFIFGKLFHANNELTFLLTIGTAICGAAAIATTAPIAKTNSENTAISVAIIAFIGTIFSIFYTVIFPFLQISTDSYAIWSGLSLHELAHVALAADVAGDDALATALLAKLSRVFLLVPISIILFIMFKRKNGMNGKVKITFPYFLIGFVLMSLFGSYMVGKTIFLSDSTIDFINRLSTFLLTSAMVGLGLNIHLKTIKEKAIKPLIAVFITSIILSVVTFVII